MVLALMKNRVKYIDLKVKEYKETWEFQQDIHSRLVRAKSTGETPDTLPCLIFVEHPHVYTLGKSGHENNLLIDPAFLKSIHATYHRTDRGGDITYHGPGQLVGYPVFDLDNLVIGAKKYIENIEDSIITFLRQLHIDAGRLEGATGVWVTAADPPVMRKICAIGVKISRGITMHGFALNVNTDLSYFSWINPCGFTDKGVTSIGQIKGESVDMDEVKEMLRGIIGEVFGVEIV